MASKPIEDPSSTIFKSTRFFDEDDEDQDKLLETYHDHFKEHKARTKVLDSLDEKKIQLSSLRAALKAKKSSLNHDNGDFSKKCDIMHKRYNKMVVECESNHSKMNFLGKGLRVIELSQENQWVVSFDLAKDKVDQVTLLG